MGVEPDITETKFPRLSNIGLSGLLVTFGDALTEPANRAALAFRAYLESATWDGVEETTTSLTSVYVGFDPLFVSHTEMARRLSKLMKSRDWFVSELPDNRKLWRIPTAFGGSHGPQLQEAAQLAQMTEQQAISELSTQQVRVLTVGCSPGQPYLGTLPECWDIPRQSGLTPKVPVGALVVAIRQFVLFTADTPTGWRHIAQTPFRGFRPESDAPFALRPGDEITFDAISAEKFTRISEGDISGNGGATWTAIS